MHNWEVQCQGGGERGEALHRQTALYSGSKGRDLLRDFRTYTGKLELNCKDTPAGPAAAHGGRLIKVDIKVRGLGMCHSAL